MHKLTFGLRLLLLFFPSFLSAQWTFHTGAEGNQPFQVIDEGHVRWLCTAAGLFRSNDGGQQYQQIKGLPETSYVGSIWLQGDSIVLALSAPDANNPNTKNAYLYWSSNRGASWQSRQINILAETVYKNIQYISDTLFIASVSHMWRSDDGGDSFQEICPQPNQGFYRFAWSGEALFMTSTGGVYRSQDRGETWQLVRALTGYGNIACSGDTLLVVTTSDSIQISPDRGDSWQTRSPNLNLGSGFVSAGLNGRFFSTFKQIYYTDDLGKTWQKLSDGNQNVFFGVYENADGIWGMSGSGLLRVEPATGILTLEAEGTFCNYNQYLIKSLGNTLYSFTADNIWSSSTDAVHWSPMAPLPSSGLAYDIDRTGDTLLLLNNLKFYFSTDEGQKWTVMPDSFDAPTALAIRDGVILAGDQTGIWRAISVLGPWTKVTAATYWITGIVTTPDKWFAVSQGGTLLTSVDAGVSWSVSAQLGSAASLSLFDLQFGAGYVFFFGTNGMLRTAASDGINWEPSPGVSPSIFYSGIAEFGKLLFLGTRQEGLYASTDSGQHWLPFHKFEGKYIASVAIWKNQLAVSVYQNGIWVYEYDLAPYLVRAFSDDNQNNIHEAGEGPYPGLVVRAKNGAYSSSDSSGLIRVFGAAPADSLYTYPPKFYTTVTPGRLLLSSLVDTPELAVYKQLVFDLRVTLVNLQRLVPGRVTAFDLICENTGSETQDAVAHIQFPPELSFVSAQQPPDSWGADSAVWTLPAFASGEIRTIHLKLKTDPAVVPGNALSLEGSIGPFDPDVYLNDNNSPLRLFVFGSYDPNDKTARLGDQIAPQQIADGTPMEYIVRFQNTGNYPATTVRIIDTLRSCFDPSTFKFLGSSHPCRWQLQGAGVVEFIFDNIQLPDSTADEPGSHGFVTYSVQPRTDLALGDTLANTASIYFDYNAPVLTNTTQTIVTEAVGVTTPSSGRAPGLSCYPNPANQLVQIGWPDTGAGGQVWIWDAAGRLVWQRRDAGSETLLTVPVSAWPAGWYRVGWLRKGELRWGKFLRVR